MNITISIPSLDRLCSILEKGIDITPVINSIHTPVINSTLTPMDTALDRLYSVLEKGIDITPAPAPAPKVKKEKVTPLAPVDPPAPITPLAPITLEDEEEETPTLVVKAPTVESITVLAKSYIAYNSPAELRNILDSAGIAGQKISTCDKSFYPAIEMALTNALEMVK